MKHTSLSSAVWLILLLFTGGIALNLYLDTQNNHRAIDAGYRQNVRNVVTLAHGILKHFDARVRAGELTETQAKARALKVISAMRYEGSNYIFMGDAEGISISNGIKELVGTNIMGMQDPTGKPLVKELYRVAAAGGGFVDYQWPDPADKSVLLPKSSYAEYFAPWQWTLGSGLDMNALAKAKQQLQQERAYYPFLLMAAAALLAVLLTRYLVRQSHRVTGALEQLAEGRGALGQPLPVEGCREMRALSAAYNRLSERLEQLAGEFDGGRRIPDRSSGSGICLEQLQEQLRHLCRQAWQLEQSHEQLKQQAEQDPATGLMTISAFENRMRDVLAQLDSNTPNTLALLAFDQLPPAKDLFLEQLSMAAGVLRHNLPDGVLACYAPEKGFIYWCRYTNTSQAMHMLLQLQQQMSEAFGETQSVSAGLSAGLGGGKSYELMFSEAERALIRAQREGGNRVYEY